MERKKAYFGKVLGLLRQCDVALEVADSRDVLGTRTRKLDMPMRSKVIIVASKADLLPKDAARMRSSDGMPVVYFSARTREGLGDVLKAIRGSKRAGKLNARGLRARVAVFGMPNTGKSSLINALRGRHVAKTGFMPGITRGEQWVNVGEGMLLCDSPGIVRFGMAREELVERGGIEVERVKEPEALAERIVARFLRAGNKSLFEFYGIGEGGEALERLARRRGLLMKGGELNLREAAKIIIRDFQKGKFVLVAGGQEGGV